MTPEKRRRCLLSISQLKPQEWARRGEGQGGGEVGGVAERDLSM